MLLFVMIQRLNSFNSLIHIDDPYASMVTSLSDIIMKIVINMTPSSFKTSDSTDYISLDALCRMFVDLYTFPRPMNSFL